MIKDIDQALDWIYSFTNLEISRTKKKFKRNYKLKKIEYLLNHIGNPHNNQNIIHIAGTKGKGSVAFILNNIFINAGFKVALYTSPHLFEVNERIIINNNPISNKDFIDLINLLQPIVESIEDPLLKPTFFDIFTSIAFYYFNYNRADIWIIETGLGGRLDSTNIVKPILSIITSISREHTKILGNTLKKIAIEKGGIIKKNTPVVVSKNRNNVVEVLKNIAQNNNSPFFYIGNFINYKFLNYTKENNKIYQTLILNNKKYLTSLLGYYQVENIACSKLAIDVINKYKLFDFKKRNFSIKNKNNNHSTTLYKKIDFDLSKDLEWKGRLTHKKINNIDIFFDGAHNRVSASMLRRSIIKMKKNNVLTSNKIISIVGILKGKDYIGILENVLKFSEIIYFIEPYQWRDSKVENYLNTFRKLNKDKNIPYFIIDNIIENIEDLINKKIFFNYIINHTKNIFKNSKFSIVVTGSLYTVAKLMDK